MVDDACLLLVREQWVVHILVKERYHQIDDVVGIAGKGVQGWWQIMW